MNVAAAIRFLRDHPNLLRLIDGFPSFERPTIDALVGFVDDALASGDPNKYVRTALDEIRKSRIKQVRVTVLEVKENKK